MTKPALVLALAIAATSACGGDPPATYSANGPTSVQSMYAAHRGPSGECPQPVPGTYQSTVVFGENSCAITPGQMVTADTFIGGGSGPSASIMGRVEDPTWCLVDVEFTASEGNRFVGTYAFHSSYEFRFTGTITFVGPDSCIARATVTYAKR